MNNHPRFWSTETLEHREIVAVAANDYGDIVLTLDGGEVWRFTPHTPTPPPDAKRVKLAGHMRHSVTKALAPNAIIMLRAPEEKIGGNLKIIPAPQPKGATTATGTQPPKVDPEALKTYSDIIRRLDSDHPKIRRPTHSTVLLKLQTPNGERPKTYPQIAADLHCTLAVVKKRAGDIGKTLGVKPLELRRLLSGFDETAAITDKAPDGEKHAVEQRQHYANTTPCPDCGKPLHDDDAICPSCKRDVSLSL